MLKVSAKRLTQVLMITTILITLGATGSYRSAFRVRSATAGNEGKRIYNTHCSICHGVDGRGNTASGKKYKAKDLRSEQVQSQSDAALTETVMEGMGQNMPGFSKKLDQEKIQQVLSYIREFGRG
jgi:mono/diheme cytochrome c family protein